MDPPLNPTQWTFKALFRLSVFTLFVLCMSVQDMVFHFYEKNSG